MAKKIKRIVRMELPAGKATPAPPVGTNLGPTGINIVNFCKEYNERTSLQAGNTIPVVVTIYEDRTYSFILKTIPTAELIKKFANIAVGSKQTKRINNGSLTKQQLYDIATLKMRDLNTQDIEMAVKMVVGTAKSMGVICESF